MSTITHCQVLGPFSTGTVLMQGYIHRLFQPVRHPDFPFWKHSLPPRYHRHADGRVEHREAMDAFPGVLFVCMVRSPYFWLPATCRRPYNLRFYAAGFDMGERLRSPVSLKGEFFTNLVQVWNGYYRRYGRYLEPGGRMLFVRLEDLVGDPLTVIHRLERHLERKPRSDAQAVVDALTRTPAKSDNAFGDVWAEKNRLERVSRVLRTGDLSFIDQQLDNRLMERFGYPLVWPAPDSAPG